MDKFIIDKFWVDCFHSQIAVGNSVKTAIHSANLAAQAYKDWTEDSVSEVVSVEETPLKKSVYDNVSCGDSVKDHEWKSDGHDAPYCMHCLWPYRDIEELEKAQELEKALESVITKTKLDEAIGQFEEAMNNYYSVAPEKALGVLTRALEKIESLCGKDETQRPTEQHQ